MWFNTTKLNILFHNLALPHTQIVSLLDIQYLHQSTNQFNRLSSTSTICLGLGRPYMLQLYLCPHSHDFSACPLNSCLNNSLFFRKSWSSGNVDTLSFSAWTLLHAADLTSSSTTPRRICMSCKLCLKIFFCSRKNQTVVVRGEGVDAQTVLWIKCSYLLQD